LDDDSYFSSSKRLTRSTNASAGVEHLADLGLRVAEQRGTVSDEQMVDLQRAEDARRERGTARIAELGVGHQRQRAGRRPPNRVTDDGGAALGIVERDLAGSLEAVEPDHAPAVDAVARDQRPVDRNRKERRVERAGKHRCPGCRGDPGGGALVVAVGDDDCRDAAGTEACRASLPPATPGRRRNCPARSRRRNR
jgi:hypothetical protein